MRLLSFNKIFRMLNYNKFLLLIFTFLIFNSSLKSQEGNNPYNIKWKTIEIKSANIIFDPAIESYAQRVANLLNVQSDDFTRSIGNGKRKIDILLQNKTVSPNGYVALPNFRSEFYSTPPEDFYLSGNNSWNDLLAIHEYRHVQQFINLKTGFPKLGSFVAGQMGWASFFFAVPTWYLEGDATLMETLLTRGGRGRMPYFTRESRALALDKIEYPYVKWRNGSYNDLVPGRYEMGYQMLSHLRNHSGNDTIKHIVNDAMFFPFFFANFSRTMNSKIGLSTGELFDSTWVTLKSKWQKNSKSIRNQSTLQLTNQANVFTKYHFPQFEKNNSILAVKESYNQTECLVRIEDKKEEVLTSMGVSWSNYFHYKNNYAIWIEQTNHSRRKNVSYFNLILYDLSKNKKETLLKNVRYYSPSFSEDGNKIVVLEIDESLQYHLVVLNKKGKVLQKIKLKENTEYSRPRFIDENTICFISKNQGKISIEKLDIGLSIFNTLLPPGYDVVNDQFYSNGRIYFSSSYDDQDNIYSVSVEGDQKIFKHTSVKVGAYQPGIDSKSSKIVYTNFNFMGQYPVLSDLINLDEYMPDMIRDSVPIFNIDNNEEGNILDMVKDSSFEVKSYNRIFKDLRFHSWLLQTNEISGYTIQGFVNNILDDQALTLEMKIGNGLAFGYGFKYINTRLFPAWSLAIQNNHRFTGKWQAPDRTFNEFIGTSEFSIPLEKLNGNYFNSFSIGSAYNYNQIYNYKEKDTPLDNFNLTSLITTMKISSVRRRAYQNLAPKFGFKLLVSQSRAFTESTSDKWRAEFELFLPAIKANHSIYISNYFRYEAIENKYLFGDDFVYARGYEAVLFDQSFTNRIAYLFPLVYPDFGVNNLFFLKRIRASLFNDFSILKNKKMSSNIWYSAGFQLLFDTGFFNLAEFPIGLQIAKPISPGGKWQFSVLTNFGF